MGSFVEIFEVQYSVYDLLLELWKLKQNCVK